jgi:5-formyltetrahydrofolate cyclo-ligase
MDKPTLRRWAQEQRATLDMAELSAVLVERLVGLPEFQAARSILLYLAMPGEVDLDALVTRAEALGRAWHVPRCAPRRRLAVHLFVPGETPLRAGPFGIREPDPEQVPEAEPGKLDLVIVPGLLLSERGERVGYGGGYYDRFLPRLRPDCARVGLMPDALVVPSLPSDPWDQPIPLIVTESRILRPAV